MITVKKKPLTPNMVWDAETNSPLCKFKKGVFQTNDRLLADRLEALGHEVSGEPDSEVQAKNVEDKTKENEQAEKENAEDAAKAEAQADTAANKSRKGGK